MYATNHKPFDFNLYKKAWHSELIDSDIDEINNLLNLNPLLNEILLLKDSALAIKDIKRMYYSCVLGDVEKVCGWSKEAFLNGGVAFYMSKIPYAEFNGLGIMTNLINEYIVTIPQQQTTQFRAFFDYKMTRSDGTINRIIQESIALKRDVNGNILFFLALVSDASNLKRDGRQHLRLTNGKENLIYEINSPTGEHRQLESLSKRELEIARLLGQNLNSEEIAEKLFISTNTVYTHRQNMLRKLGMTDTLELINFVSLYRLI